MYIRDLLYIVLMTLVVSDLMITFELSVKHQVLYFCAFVFFTVYNYFEPNHCQPPEMIRKLLENHDSPC